MTKEFEKKVLKENIVDTKKYRYATESDTTHKYIKRLPLELLGTTGALDGWEVVKTY